jgi:uncharacterized SAM-binding protein YcdF (DUF218 family)
VLAPSAIVVLSGGELGAISRHADQVNLSDAADRFTTALMLARRFPEASVLYVGQSVHLPGGVSLPRAYFEASGLDPGRLEIEPLSRNTWENARFSRDMAPPEGPYLLVTSAFHMRRAVGLFCQAGWRGLVPWPVDYRTAGWAHLRWQPNRNMHLLNMAVRERLALLAYRVTGRLAGPEALGVCLAHPRTRTGDSAGPG